ncbi:MAG: histidine kinase, partial [Clostridiales bacterium]|nr:histidine kinase [Clostridiales bacterium]
QQLQEAVVLQLRSQIMPHFLFNTLNIISRTARVEGAPKTEELLYALAHLFRASLQSTVAGQVTLAEEINMARNYFILQQARFGSRVGLTFRVAKDVYPEELQVPSFFLQPLVENSILHSLENRVDGGRVRVRIQRDETHLYISICDNGSGMSRERLAEVIREDTVRERRVTGIGVRNVRARILMAHPGNAFTLYSKENLGTIVRITLYLEEE